MWAVIFGDALKTRKGLQAETCNPLMILVRLAGIEPTTPWFVAKYSIQLSYSRENKIIADPISFWKAGFMDWPQYSQDWH